MQIDLDEGIIDAAKNAIIQSEYRKQQNQQAQNDMTSTRIDSLSQKMDSFNKKLEDNATKLEKMLNLLNTEHTRF